VRPLQRKHRAAPPCARPDPKSARAAPHDACRPACRRTRPAAGRDGGGSTARSPLTTGPWPPARPAARRARARSPGASSRGRPAPGSRVAAQPAAPRAPGAARRSAAGSSGPSASICGSLSCRACAGTCPTPGSSTTSSMSRARQRSGRRDSASGVLPQARRGAGAGSSLRHRRGDQREHPGHAAPRARLPGSRLPAAQGPAGYRQPPSPAVRMNTGLATDPGAERFLGCPLTRGTSTP
jgi:hypothetical protein